MSARVMPRIAALLALALVSAGCASGRPAAVAGPGAPAQRIDPFPVKDGVALAPLENHTPNPDAATAVLQVLDDALRESGVNVVGRLEGSLVPGRLATPLELQQSAATLGAMYTLSGTVLEYGMRPGARTGEPPEPIVSVDLRLVDVSTGGIVWQHSFYGSTADLSSLENEGLGSVSRTLAKTVAQALAPANGGSTSR